MRTLYIPIMPGVLIAIKYDETAPCIMCGHPVVEATPFLGPLVCTWCAEGKHRDGRTFTDAEVNESFRRFYINLRRLSIEGLPTEDGGKIKF